MKVKPFYTVVKSTTFKDEHTHFYIRYVLPPYWTVQEFPEVDYGGYADPGEASREFKKYQQFQSAEHLSKSQFEGRIRKHERDVAKLKAWLRADQDKEFDDMQITTW